MTVNDYAERYRDQPVVEFRMGGQARGNDVVYRLTQDYDSQESQTELLDSLLGQTDPGGIRNLIIGPWSEAHDDSPQAFLDRLIERRSELGALQGLFVGDMTYEDCEISWIIQCGYNGVLDAFPQLRSLRIRGSTRLELQAFAHEHLEELAIECGGLPSRIVEAIAASRLPALRRLELWLGDDNYGFDGDLGTYAKLLDAIAPERLEYLGLRNAQISDALAVHLAAQPWLASLKTLDLSMGTIGDVGAKALFESPYVRSLGTLDLSHHYIGEEWRKKLATLPCKVVLADEQDEDQDGEESYRYVQVAE